MKAAAVFVSLSIGLILSVFPVFAGKQEMTEQELASTKLLDPVNIHDIVVTELSSNVSAPHVPTQLMIIFERLPGGSAQDQSCATRGCGDAHAAPSFRFFPFYK